MAREKRHRRVKPKPVLRGDLGLFKMGASRFEIRDPYYMAVSLSWPAFAVAFVGVWFTLNLLFALLYVLSPGDIANASPGSFTDAFFFSVETLATVGYGVMAPDTLWGHVVSSAEIVTGMVFTAIFTGLLFVRFSRANPKIVYADDAVITTYNGRQTLMLRLANARMTMMTNANVRMFVLVEETTDEGTHFRRIHELHLVQSHMPLFVMPWTLIHQINDASPLCGCNPSSIMTSDTRVFVTVEVRDKALGAAVYDMKYYDAPHIMFGMRYADAVTIDGNGQVTADLTRISLLEPDPGGNPEARWSR